MRRVPTSRTRTEKKLDDGYFTQTLLPDFMADNEELTAAWDVVFDDRGHFSELHTGHTVGLGTLNVRKYLDEHSEPGARETSVERANVNTRGPNGCYAGILFVEKEGFDELFEAVKLDERYDIAIMSCKGLTVTAARKLIDELAGSAFRCSCCTTSTKPASRPSAR